MLKNIYFSGNRFSLDIRGHVLKIVQINSVCVGSTGKICMGIRKVCKNQSNIDNRIIYFSGRNKKENIKLSNCIYQKYQALKSRITGNYAFTATINSYRVIKYLKQNSPDIVHLHNIHDHSLNYEILFRYLGEHSINTVWTLHDCSAFTGYCMHFQIAKCDKWKTICEKCPQYKQFSWFFDKSTVLFNKKKALTDNMQLTLVTPSYWLQNLVRASFLHEHDIYTINNGIDLSIFYPRASNFKENYNIKNKNMILGVAFDWGYKKGLDVFIELSTILDSSFQIVLVGTNDKIDRLLPRNIISIHRTSNQSDLAEIYSAADVFVNPTREDTYPTVNMESIACGTPVVTFNTGGSPEMVDKECGIVVKDNLKDLFDAIKDIKNNKEEYQKSCLLQANKFDENVKYNQYVELYKYILEKG